MLLDRYFVVISIYFKVKVLITKIFSIWMLDLLKIHLNKFSLSGNDSTILPRIFVNSVPN